MELLVCCAVELFPAIDLTRLTLLTFDLSAWLPHPEPRAPSSGLYSCRCESLSRRGSDARRQASRHENRSARRPAEARQEEEESGGIRKKQEERALKL